MAASSKFRASPQNQKGWLLLRPGQRRLQGPELGHLGTLTRDQRSLLGTNMEVDKLPVCRGFHGLPFGAMPSTSILALGRVSLHVRVCACVLDMLSVCRHALPSSAVVLLAGPEDLVTSAMVGWGASVWDGPAPLARRPRVDPCKWVQILPEAHLPP